MGTKLQISPQSITDFRTVFFLFNVSHYCFYYHLFDSVVIRDYRAWERKIKKAVPGKPEQLFVYCILA